MQNGFHRQPNLSSEFRRCLVDCDIEGIRKLWKHIAPQMPQPETDEDTLIQIHLTRTATERLPFRFRAYSHAWIMERARNMPGLRSLLPDELRPKAERMYPRIVEAVGICVSGLNNVKTDYHHFVSTKLCQLVEDMYAGKTSVDPALVKARMKELHDRLRKEK